jgi:hypothetical protein
VLNNPNCKPVSADEARQMALALANDPGFVINGLSMVYGSYWATYGGVGANLPQAQAEFTGYMNNNCQAYVNASNTGPLGSNCVAAIVYKWQINPAGLLELAFDGFCGKQ